MEDEKDGLKLLKGLQKLNGLPLEQKGEEIKKSLNIDKTLLQKVEDISGPYILLQGDGDKAISLAAYIYLEKSTVYSDIDLREKLKKAKKPLKIYLELFHVRPWRIPIRNRNKLTGRALPAPVLMDPVPITYCTYINPKTGRSSKPSFQLENNNIVFNDYHKGKEHKPYKGKDKLTERIIYKNHFRYVDRENSYPDKLLQLKIIDHVLITVTTCAMKLFDMLKFKNTVFLLNFMIGIKNEDIDSDKLREFANKLHTLKKDTPGFLIFHIDNAKKWPPYFLDLFKSEDMIVIPESLKKEGETTTKNKKGKGAKGTDRFDDVELKVFVYWNTSYLNSEYDFEVKHKESSEYEELKLDRRFKPVLYRLAKGVHESIRPINYTSKQDLITAFFPRKDIDDAIKNIIKEFVKIIGPRGKEIIFLIYGKGRRLQIRKKNIKINDDGGPPF